jgi:phosphatidylethanolamine/phosphatidyl-N-methylethanolamine N-methyltransferase
MSVVKPPSDVSSGEAENAFVERVYDKIASVYDLAFGPILQPGRRRAMAVMDPAPGTRVLEVGVGTGLNLSLYPRECDVTGIDFSALMLVRADERVAREGLRARLFQMDAADLRFPDDSFDVVYAPYVISVVQDPVAVLREMHRVCRPGGRILILNHFQSTGALLSRIERWLSPRTVHIGFKADVDREALFAEVGFTPESIEAVNVPRLWSLVSVRKQCLTVDTQACRSLQK